MGRGSLFPDRRRKPHARVRLVCLPYSGGSALLYRDWDRRLGGYQSNVEVCGVELPGRGGRFDDDPWTDAELAAREIAAGLAELPPLPTVLFGQSLGARLAFVMVSRAGVQPAAVIAAAAAAPSLDRVSGFADLPRDELVRELVQFGGMSREALANEDLMELMLPVIRADLRLSAWRARVDERVTCPITVLWGRGDPTIKREQAASWAAHTSGHVEIVEVDGGHFFVAERIDDVIAQVRKVIGAG